MGIEVKNIKGNGRKKLLVLGNTGDGKSTLCNILSGFDPSEQSMFPVSGGANSCTQETKFADVFFNGNKENPVSMIDTIGWSDSGKLSDAKIIEELITKLKHACDHVNLFVLAVNGHNPRITSTNIEMFETFTGMFTKVFLDQVVVIFTRWSMHAKEVSRRHRSTGKSDDERAQDYVKKLQDIFKLQRAPDYLIIDAHYDDFDDGERAHFNCSIDKLYRRLQSSSNMPTVNVERVKTTNMKLRSDLAEKEDEIAKVREEIKRQARELEQAEAREAQRRAERQREQQARENRGAIQWTFWPIPSHVWSFETCLI